MIFALLTLLLPIHAAALTSQKVKPAPPKEAKKSYDVSADSVTIRLVEKVVSTPTADLDPVLVQPFLAVKIPTLPKKLQRKAQQKQIEIGTLIKLHATKKSGSIVQPLSGCDEKDFVLPLDQANLYASIGYEGINEDDEQCVQEKTKCTEIDLGCRFSLKVFYKKKKPRRLMFYASDPIMAIVASCRGKGGTGTHFFGLGYTCMH